MNKKELICKLRTSYEIKISPDGRYLVHIGSKIKVLDFVSFEVLKSFTQLKYPSYIAFSPDSLHMAIKNTSGWIAVFNLQDMSHVYTFKLGGGDGSNIWFTSDNKYIINGDWKGNITKIDLSTKTVELVKTFNECTINKIDYDYSSNSFIYHVFYRGMKNNESYDFLFKWKYPFEENCPEEILLPKGFDYGHFCYSNFNKCYVFIVRNLGDESHIRSLMIINSKSNEVANLIRMNISNEVMNWSSDGKYICVIGERLSTEGITPVKIIRYSDFYCVKEYLIKYPCYVEFSLNDRFLLIGAWDNGYVLDLSAITDNA